MPARSTAASVCPARTSTPPLRARSGNTCPGLVRSRGRELGSIATRTVCARSAAEMPVVVSSRASIDTHIAVSRRDELSFTSSGIASWSSRSGTIARQMSPRPCRAMKLIASGVTFEAAMVRSPSFSRASSSTTTTMRPARIASTASSMDAKGPRRRAPLAMRSVVSLVVMIYLPPACVGRLRPGEGEQNGRSHQESALPMSTTQASS